MRLSDQKKIRFYPDSKVNFELSSYGLSNFYRKPLKNNQAKIKDNKNPKKMEKENKDDLMFTPGEKEEKKGKHFLKYAAIGLIGPHLQAQSIISVTNTLQTKKLNQWNWHKRK